MASALHTEPSLSPVLVRTGSLTGVDPLSGLGWLSSDFQGSDHLCDPSSGITGTPLHLALMWDLEIGLRSLLQQTFC